MTEEETHFLELEDLLYLAEHALGPTEPQVRDMGLLQSAVERARTTVFGEDAYPTIGEKSAALTESLVANHALVDDNKRLAYAALWLFLEVNGLTLGGSDDEHFDLVMAIADGSLRGVPEIADRLAGLVDLPSGS